MDNRVSARWTSSGMKYILIMVLTSVMWSSGGILIKLVSTGSLAVSGLRSLIASMIILMYLRKPKFTWSLYQVLGGAAYASMAVTFVAATRLTTAANAVLLQYTAPIYVAILGSIILKEKVASKDIAVIAVTIIGIIMFFADSFAAGGLLGNILAIISGFCFALFVVSSRQQKSESPMETILLGNLITAVVCIPFVVSAQYDTKSILGIALLGIVQFGVPYVLYGIAIKHIRALDAVMIAVIEPILNPVWVFLFLGEKPGFWAVLGGAIVMIAITYNSLRTSKENR
ncbi:MAG: rane protein [Clostridia bacterium]|jgi:drug/metabolite transporter (DMT)-like permease|nr:rane protein [Clostridia bacterium]